MLTYDLTPARAAYAASLATPCSINRKATDPDGLSTGQTTVEVASTFCAVNLLGGTGNSTFTDTLLRAISAKTPGARILSFKWNEDVQKGDVIITSQGKFKLGLVNTDDPMRVGIQAEAEIERPT